MLEGAAGPGSPLPTIRSLATRLGLSPATVASGYRLLHQRGIASAQGRRGSRITASPPLPGPRAAAVPPGARDLVSGSPDPALLPDLRPSLGRLAPRSGLYGAPACDETLLELGRSRLAQDGLEAEHLTVVAGALDGVERSLSARLRPGDAVAVEDPGYAGVLELVTAMGLVPVPVPVDNLGIHPERLAPVLGAGARAVVLTPRAHNPTGAALDGERAAGLTAVLEAHPDVLLVEDDHAGPVAGAPAVSATAGLRRWCIVRSVSKSLGPDLRLAMLAGDATTVARVEGRQRLGAGWVSHLLQGLVADLWRRRSTSALLARATATYAGRRRALLEALAARGISGRGRSGLNVWIPVTAEQPIVGGLLARGWAVAAGERYRLRSSPGIRVTTATLEPEEAHELARDLAAVLAPSAATRLG